MVRFHRHPGGITVEASLAWLLQPLSVRAFLDEIFGAKHYHINRGAPGYFDTVLPGPRPAADLVQQLKSDPAAVRAVNRDAHRDSAVYQLSDGTLDIAGVHADLADGYTIVVDRLERYLRSIAALSHSIEVELNFATQVNAYITPPGSVGFAAHYDHHDVLILQIQGCKTWHLSGDAAVAPHDMQRRKEISEIFGAELPAPTDLVLQAGDTLYLPRGQVHAAEAGPEQSVHLTVGMHVPTVLTLLTNMLQLLSYRDDRVHARLPAHHLDDPDARAGVRGIVSDALDLLSDPGVIADGVDAFEDLLTRRGRCPPVGQVSDTVGIQGQTLVVKHQPLYSRVIRVADRVGLQFAQLVVSAGSDHESAMRFLSHSSEPFRVDELPGLTAAQQTELARTLIMSGFLIRLR